METIEIHILHTGKVCVSPHLPFGGEHCSTLKAAGVFTQKKDRLWLPVSVYLIKHPKGRILIDCGWHRNMSPDGTYDRKAQIHSLGSPALYLVNQGVLEPGCAVNEQLSAMGIAPHDLDYVVLTHLDCDHANGLQLVKDAKQILVSQEEWNMAKRPIPMMRLRFNARWWKDVRLQTYPWNCDEGPFRHSYDLLGDGSVQMIHIPGHTAGQVAVKVQKPDGAFVLLTGDGAYGQKSWAEMVLPGISLNRKKQRTSLQWIREQSLLPGCKGVFATHDTEVQPGVVYL